MAKSIVEKLNLNKFKKKVILHLPDGADYFAELEDYERDVSDPPYDLIFAFVFDMASLQSLVNRVIENHELNKNGYFYIAYPKKGNKVYPTFIHRDDLMKGLGADEAGYVGNSTIKFARMVALDDLFTVVGLKEDSKNKNRPSAKPSQRVDDYVHYIPEVERDLENHPELLAFFRSLSPGTGKIGHGIFIVRNRRQPEKSAVRK